MKLFDTMNYLITGHKGFLGSILYSGLKDSGHQVQGLSRSGDGIRCNLDVQVPALPQRYEVVIHAAGKAHRIPRTPKEAQSFFQTNVSGTRHLLQALSEPGRLPDLLVFISSVAVYGCEYGLDLDESTPLDGKTPYARSKIEAEHLVIQWAQQRGVKYLCLRLPLVAGPNPPGNLGAMIQAMRKGWYVTPGNRKARKSLVLAADLVSLLQQIPLNSGVYNLTDGRDPTLGELEQCIADQLQKKMPRILPMGVLKRAARLGDFTRGVFPLTTARLNKLTASLTFSCNKAVHELNWKPNQVTKNFRIQ